MLRNFSHCIRAVAILLSLTCAAFAAANQSDARLQKAYRFQQGGWTYVHLEGLPADIGFQHGYLLAPEIADALAVIKLSDTRRTQRDWEFFRTTARQMLWPHIDAEYQQELQGIADGVKAHGVDLDVYDIVALNAFEEVPDYYVPWLNKQTANKQALNKSQKTPKLSAPGNCSAFIATGSMTKDHQIVIAHNNWTSYLNGERWVIVFDIQPEHGNRILMDGFPGVITSDDDFGVNSAGIMITETTIDSFVGFNPKGVPEAVRMREAIQYSETISDVVRWFTEDNNGAYANMWLIGDTKSNEIASLELGLKNVAFHRTSDGAITSCNCPIDPKLTSEECIFDAKKSSNMSSDRQARWAALMDRDRGKIDAELGKAYLGDHWNAILGQSGASLSTLCGHGEVESRPDHSDGQHPFSAMGAVQGKVVTTGLANKMSFWARMGHPCGEPFVADAFLKAHPEYAWQKSILGDMPTQPWTLFASK